MSKPLLVINRDLTYPFDVHSSCDVVDSTKLNGFMTCPRSFFYNYVLGWQQENNHLVFGKAWHEAMEHILLSGPDGYKKESVHVAYAKFMDEYRKVYHEEDDELYSPKTPTRAAMALMTYVKHYANDWNLFEVVELDGKLLTEIAGSVPVGKYELAFRMDAVVRHLRTGRVSPFEHKTGSSLYMWEEQWDLAMQVFCYLYVMYCLFDPQEVEGVLLNGVIFKKTKDNTATDAKHELGFGRHFEFVRPLITRQIHQMEAWITRTVYHLDMVRMHFDMLAEEDPGAKVMRAFPMVTTSCTKYMGCEYKNFCLNFDNPIKQFLKYQTPVGWEVKHWDPTIGEIRTNLGRVQI